MLLNDVTLREGDQMPGRDYSVEQKVEAGCALDDLGVSYIQTGFPITGERDREATRASQCWARPSPPTSRASARILLQRADIEPTDERIDELLLALDEEGPLELAEAVALAGEPRK